MTSEELWRAALHDFNNLLAGFQGVLDLSDPRMPLDARNRVRLEASIEDGKTLIAMARAMALGRLPDAGMASWAEWRSGFEARMVPLCSLYHCRLELDDREAPGAPWPAPLFQDWATAFTRQILPWSAPEPIRLRAQAEPEAWVLTWLGDAPMPAALQPEAPPDAARNLPSIWLKAMAERMGVQLECAPEGLRARLPRPCAS